MTMVIKRHHTVPNFYLRNFASSGARPTIGSVKLDDGKRVPQSTNDASVYKHFYSLDGHPEGADVFERAISRLESDASIVIGKIINGTWPVSVEDRQTLGEFLVFQFLRGPDTRDSWSHLSSEVARMTIKVLGRDGVRRKLHDQGKPVVDEALERLFEQVHESDEPLLRMNAYGHINQMLELVPKLLPYFVRRPWMLYRFERKTLLTSDAPVSLVPDVRLNSPHPGVGLQNAWAISVPLTRRMGLLLGNPDPLIEDADEQEMVARGESTEGGAFDRELVPSVAMANLFNSQALSNAHKWVFHHPDDGELVPSDLWL